MAVTGWVLKKQTLRPSLGYKMFTLGSDTCKRKGWEIQLWLRPSKPWPTCRESRESLSHQAKMTRPFHLHLTQSPNVGLILGKTALCSWGRPQRGWAAGGFLLPGLPAAGQQVNLCRGIWWWISMSITMATPLIGTGGLPKTTWDIGLLLSVLGKLSPKLPVYPGLLSALLFSSCQDSKIGTTDLSRKE